MNGDMLADRENELKELEDKGSVEKESDSGRSREDSDVKEPLRNRIQSYSLTSYKTFGEDGEKIAYKNGLIDSATSMAKDQQSKKIGTLENEVEPEKNSFETELNQWKERAIGDLIQKVNGDLPKEPRHGLSSFCKILHQNRQVDEIDYKSLYLAERKKVEERDETITKLKMTSFRATSEKLNLIKNYENLIRKLKKVNEVPAQVDNRPTVIRVTREDPKNQTIREKPVKSSRRRCISLEQDIKPKRLSLSRDRYLTKVDPSTRRITIRDKVIFDYKGEYAY